MRAPEGHTGLMSMASTLARAVDATLEATVLGSFTRAGVAVRSHLPGWADAPAGVLAGRTAVVTGATSGIGAALAAELGAFGAHVHVVGRDEAKVAATVEGLVRAGASAEAQRADLAVLADVRAVATRLVAGGRPIDVLAHVAGALVERRQNTVDGVELTAQVHVVAPFLLTTLLLDPLRASADGRVITMSSGGMYTKRLDVDDLLGPPGEFNGTTAYARAKRAQVELTAEWAARHPDDGIGFHAVHPGWVDTPGLHESLPRFARLLGPALRTPQAGADTAAWLAWTSAAPAPGGDFWHDRRRRRTESWPGTSAPPGERTRLWSAVAAAADLHP